MAKKASTNDDVIIIKKYANRRLYNTATSSYVTLDYLCEMVKAGEDFVVKDAKSGDDITRSVLTQIIFEEEGKGEQHMLPVSFLRRLIGFYGDNLQSFVPSYLEMSMDAFAKNQEKMRTSMSETFGAGGTAGSPFGMFEDMARKNMGMFEQGVKMFGGKMPSSPMGGFGRSGDGDTSEVELLKSQIEELKQQLAAKK